MTDAPSKPDLGRFGSFGRGVTPQQAKDIEALGYGAVWVGGSPPAELAWVEPLLEATTTLQVGTGIVNIWTAAAKPVAESFHRIEAAYPGRFLLGIGVGHPEAHTEYRKPYDALADYLKQLDDYGVPANRRVVAALGPRVLKLSAERSAGAHPYLTTPEHTARAREIIGPSAFLAPEHKAILTPTPRRPGRSAARRSTSISISPTTETTGSGWVSARTRSPGRAATGWWTRSWPMAPRTRSRRGSPNISRPAPITSPCRS